jgi:hypothetical protein
MTARSQVMSQTKRDTLALQVRVGRGAKHKTIYTFSMEIFLRRG